MLKLLKLGHAYASEFKIDRAKASKMELLVNFPKLELFSPDSNLDAEKESQILDLNSEKSIKRLKWNPSFSQKQAIESTFYWWRKTMENKGVIKELCLQDVKWVVDGHLHADSPR